MSYYGETKWCPRCGGYVRYLRSLNGDFCVHHPDTKARVFSDEDREAFLIWVDEERDRERRRLQAENQRRRVS